MDLDCLTDAKDSAAAPRRSFREIVKYSRVLAGVAGEPYTLEARLLRVKRGLRGASEFCKTRLAIFNLPSLPPRPPAHSITLLPPFGAGGGTSLLSLYETLRRVVLFIWNRGTG